MSATFSRSTIELYRDCFRLIRHIAGTSSKGIHLRAIVRNEFKKNMSVTDPTTVAALKSNAVRALTNYLMLESSNKDQKLRDRIAEFNKVEFDSLGKGK